LARLFRLYGDRIAFCGGVDARVLIANDRAAIDAELEAKVRPVLEGGGYILSSDHSEPPEVSYDTIRYFLEKGIGMSRHRQPAAKRKEGNVS
jgi:uroporphyrinogen-III decarboxylase